VPPRPAEAQPAAEEATGSDVAGTPDGAAGAPLTAQGALGEATEHGMIGLLNTGAAKDPNAPKAPRGRDAPLGADEAKKMEDMWGDENDLALGTGQGRLYRPSAQPGQAQAESTSAKPRASAPQVRMGDVQVSGRLAPEVIKRIGRQNYGRFRLCYEQGLGRNPDLAGTVTVRFVIGTDGAVSNVSNGGSDLADSGVVNCVIKAFYGLSFPKPEGGVVTVQYPILLQPG